MSVMDFPVRKQKVMTARPAGFVQARMREATSKMSRLAMFQARSELLNEAVFRMIGLAYEVDEFNRFVNVDEMGLILIPVPWSSHGYRRWGLRATESDVLRAYLLRLAELAHKGERIPPLFLFDPVTRRWSLNFFDYPTYEAAVEWWSRFEMGPGTYRSFADYVRKKRRSAAKKRGDSADKRG